MPPVSSGSKDKALPSNKRKAPDSSDNASSKRNQVRQGGGWAQKRVKIREDREIATQHPDLAFKDGELDLQKFLTAQEFSIKALEESMRHVKGEATSRAFQSVPRGMRRRTASHNVKRVPKRLRRRAEREMRDDNTPTVTQRRRKPTTTRARIRAETARKLGILAEKKRKRKLKAAREKKAKQGQERQNGGTGNIENVGQKKAVVATRLARPKVRRNQLNEPPKPKARFRKRQINKTWLPTHMWHAKRARMTPPKEPLWRFAVPLTPNEKTYRATHRAQGDKGTVAWDMSYTSTIGLYGNESGVEKVLRKLGVVNESCWNARGQKWRAGTRHWTGFLSKEAKGGRRDVCPATIVWNPPTADKHTGSEEESQVDPKKVQRQLFLRVHPSAFLELFNELLRLVKAQNPRLYIEDLRFEVGSIEITGPASTETLLGILHPYYSGKDATEKHAEMFTNLTSITGPASVPPNSVLAFSVLDPRLRYPPRKVKPPYVSGDQTQGDLFDMLATWPSDQQLQPYDIFRRDARFNASRLPSQKIINRRKGAKTPGTYLDAGPTDPPIPVVLMATRPAPKKHAQGTWTLLAPFKCIQPIWYSLVHFPLSSGGNPHFGGLNEARQVPFERGLPCFPYDYLGTDAGAEWEVEERARRKRAWERRPKSKRVAWESVELGAGRKGELGDGWACDLEHLFGLKRAAKDGGEQQDPKSGDEMDVDAASSDPKGGDEASDKPRTSAEAEPLKLVQQMSMEFFKALLAPESSSSSLTVPPNSIMPVTITLTTRGVASPCARIYRLPSKPAHSPPAPSAEVPASAPPPRGPSSTGLPSDLRDQWLAQLPPSQGTFKSPSSSSARGRLDAHTRGAVRVPASADEATRKRLLAQALTAEPTGWPPPKANQADMNGHPLVPDEDDLIGFVTTGAFCLSEGRATAVGSIAVEKVLAGLREGRGQKVGTKPGERRLEEGKICIVRNAGESVGWLARWEVA